MPDDVKVSQGYSLTKGLKKAVTATLLPAVGVALTGLLLDPEFVGAIKEHLGTVAGGGSLSFILLLAVNWAKNKNK